MVSNPKTTKETLKPQSPSASSPSHFSFTIIKVAVSQICRSIGFKGSQISALETLTHISTIYLQTLAKIAASHAAHFNRTDSNLFDVIAALEDLASMEGFCGASDIQKSILRSTTLIDIMNFVNRTNEIPFAKPIPRSNLSRNTNFGCYSGQDRQRRRHIPHWLPTFPDPSTYKIQIIEKSWKKFDVLERDIKEDLSGNERGGKRESGGGERKKCELEMLGRRERVRFRLGIGKGGVRMGVDLRNGACRVGKRNWSDNGMNKEDCDGDDKGSRFKRKRVGN